MVKIILAALTATLVTVGGGVALAHNPDRANNQPINGYTKDQCKDGGWQEMGLGFKNQGDCVSYFATGGRNQPN